MLLKDVFDSILICDNDGIEEMAYRSGFFLLQDMRPVTIRPWKARW